MVIWASGHTPGLAWELKYARANIAPTRLLIWVHVHVIEVGSQQRKVEWDRFRKLFLAAFKKSLSDDFEHTQFVAFRDDWTPIPIPGTRYLPSALERLESSKLGLGTEGLRQFLEERLRS